LHLRGAGLYGGNTDDDELNQVEEVLLESMRERFVDYAGPLAGYRVGLFTSGAGRRVLVTTEANPSVFDVPTGRVKFPNLERFMDELFGADQLPYILGWLKYARASLRRQDFRPGQMVCLAGPHSCGKGMFQSLVTAFLGGRAAKPYRYMTGATSFNADLAEAEHLYIEDEQGGSDIRTRRSFGAALKDFTVNTEMSIHGKGKKAVLLPTFRRITLSVNDEPENLMILPPLDDSILDKIMLFQVRQTSVADDRLKNWATLAAELPALAAFLHGWQIPRAMRDARYGVRSYQSPALLDLLCDIAPETRLLGLVDEVLWQKKNYRAGVFTGSSEQLECELRASPFVFAVEKLLYFSSACGVYLARLAQRYPQRFSCDKRNGKTQWTIKRA
jgi:hypothetical protein